MRFSLQAQDFVFGIKFNIFCHELAIQMILYSFKKVPFMFLFFYIIIIHNFITNLGEDVDNMIEVSPHFQVRPNLKKTCYSM